MYIKYLIFQQINAAQLYMTWLHYQMFVSFIKQMNEISQCPKNTHVKKDILQVQLIWGQPLRLTLHHSITQQSRGSLQYVQCKQKTLNHIFGCLGNNPASPYLNILTKKQDFPNLQKASQTINTPKLSTAKRQSTALMRCNKLMKFTWRTKGL